MVITKESFQDEFTSQTEKFDNDRLLTQDDETNVEVVKIVDEADEQDLPKNIFCNVHKINK